jgi:RNA polymerase sigma-70 factor (ECF subfamily)
MCAINGGNVSSNAPDSRRDTTGRGGEHGGGSQALITSDGTVWTWAQLIEEFGPAVHSYARARGVTEAEDLVQDVFTAVVQKVPTFSGSSAELRSFVFTVAFRRVADRHRRVYRRQRLWREPVALVHHPDESVLDDDDGARAIAALDRLDERSQAVLRLRYIDGRDVAEVAALMNLSATNVRAIQSRALKRLRERFKGLSAGVRHGSLAVLAWSWPVVTRHRLRLPAGGLTRRWGVLRRVRERMLAGAFGLGDAGAVAAGGASLVAAVSLAAASILGGGSTAPDRVAAIDVVTTQPSAPAGGTTPLAPTGTLQVLPAPGAPEPYVAPLVTEPVGLVVPAPVADDDHEPADDPGQPLLPGDGPPPDDPAVHQVPATIGGDSLVDRLPAPDVMAAQVDVVARLDPGVVAGPIDALPTPLGDLTSVAAGATVATTIDAPGGAEQPPPEPTVTAAPATTPVPAPAPPDVGLTVIDVPVAGDLLSLGEVAAAG